MCCLPVALHEDMQRAGLQFATAQDLHGLRHLAPDRQTWNDLVNEIAPRPQPGVYLRDESRSDADPSLVKS